MNDFIIRGVKFEMEQAERQHGPLTGDNFRAMTILTEEVGEVCKELLMIRRSHNHVQERHHREGAVRELLQVMATAAHMINNITNGTQEK